MTSSMLDGSGLCGAGWTHEASTRSAHASHAGVAEVWWRGVVCGCAHPTTTERRSTGSCVTLIRSGVRRNKLRQNKLVLPERLRLWSNVCFLQTQLPQQRAKCWSKPHQRCRRLQDWGGK